MSLQDNNNSFAPQFMDFQAANVADFMGPGAVEVPIFQSEILDLLRFRGILGQRLHTEPATGHPTRYIEQSAAASGDFVDPRNLQNMALSGVTTLPSGSLAFFPGKTTSDVYPVPTRIEKYVPVKALAGQINFGLFDRELTEQQGRFPGLVAKDLKQMVENTLSLEDKALWIGNSGSNSLQYDGLLTAITQTGTIAPGVSIINSIRTQIAQMVNNQRYTIRPTAIYMNSIAQDLFEQEMIANKVWYVGDVQVTPGVTANAIQTQAGKLPVINDWTMPQLAGGAGFSATYPIVILTENLLEYHYVTTPQPRVFQMGLVNDIASKYALVKFGTLVVKAASYAHAILNLQR